MVKHGLCDDLRNIWVFALMNQDQRSAQRSARGNYLHVVAVFEDIRMIIQQLGDPPLDRVLIQLSKAEVVLSRQIKFTVFR